MSVKINEINEERIENIEKCMCKINENFPSLLKEFIPGAPQLLYHYTSFEKLFNILDNDSFWASRSRFSNDSTEDRILGANWLKREQYYGDNYIICFSDEDDILSQWRGYCPQGGVSIGFRFPEGYSTYTLLHANYDEKSSPSFKNFELYKNRLYPVIYCPPNEEIAGSDTERLLNFFEEPQIQNMNLCASDIVPYLKNDLFHEEHEYRLVFDNSNKELEKCVRFRKLADGSMVPYIVVKCGNLLESGRKLSITYDEKIIEDVLNKSINFDCSKYRRPIIIPFGKDQPQIYASFFQRIREYKKTLFKDENNYPDQIRWERNPVQIICDGHLPIVSITVSPSPEQERMKEVIERFCQSKYWLQNVQVKCSKIPYIAPKL